jgi:hypothetical protein
MDPGVAGIHCGNDRRFPVIREDLGIKLSLDKRTFESVDFPVGSGGRETQMVGLNSHDRPLNQKKGVVR